MLFRSATHPLALPGPPTFTFLEGKSKTDEERVTATNKRPSVCQGCLSELRLRGESSVLKTSLNLYPDLGTGLYNQPHRSVLFADPGKTLVKSLPVGSHCITLLTNPWLDKHHDILPPITVGLTVRQIARQYARLASNRHASAN